MNTAEFTRAYEKTFREHAESGGERTLQAAYELGRGAVDDGLSLLELAEIHHAVLRTEIERGVIPAAELVRAAGDFHVECISAYEMLRRGFEEERQNALTERARLQMLRQLSDFMADASLASDSPGSLEEVLQLIAEQAREVIGTRLCVINLEELSPVRAVSYDHDRDDVETKPEGHLSAVDGPPDTSGSALRAELRSLDGRGLGALEVFDKEEGEFTSVDRATVKLLAEMASATLERVHLYAQKPHEKRAGDIPVT